MILIMTLTIFDLTFPYHLLLLAVNLAWIQLNCGGAVALSLLGVSLNQVDLSLNG
jgi:hypothetical protein